MLGLFEKVGQGYEAFRKKYYLGGLLPKLDRYNPFSRQLFFDRLISSVALVMNIQQIGSRLLFG